MILLRRLGSLALLTGLVVSALAGEHKKPAPPPTSELQIVVVRDNDGKPVRNAEIVLHPVDPKGRQKDEGLELKTHGDGKAEITGIPYGKMRIQVIAPGFKTYGEDFDINQPNHEFTIKLQKPAEQFSIYK
jgi:Carboxypeptidase regulatory-like domain